MQGFKFGLDEDSIKSSIERFKQIINDLGGIAKNNPITIGINIDNINLLDTFTKKVDDLKKKIEKMPDVTKGTAFKNENINTQAYDSLLERVEEIKKQTDSLARYEFDVDRNGKVSKALITYRDELGKIVKETMQWRTVQEETDGVIRQTKIFDTSGFKYVDDLTQKEKAQSNIDNFVKRIDDRFDGLQHKYAEIFNNPDFKRSVQDSVQFLKGEIESTKLDPRVFDKDDFNRQWKSIATYVQDYNTKLQTSSKEQEDLYKSVIALQNKINKYQTDNLTADSAIRERNEEKISNLTKQEQQMIAQLNTMKEQKNVADYLKNIDENRVELQKDYDAKAKSIANKSSNTSDKGALDEVLSLQKEISNLQTKNITAENAIKIRNDEKIKSLKEQLETSKALLKTDEERNVANKNQTELNKDLLAKETSGKQSEEYSKAEKVLQHIYKLKSDIANLNIEENNKENSIVQELDRELLNFEQIKNANIELSNQTKTRALNEEQLLKLSETEVDLNKKLVDLENRNSERNKGSSGTVDPNKNLPNFGKEISSGLNFNSTREELEKFIQTYAGSTSKVTLFNEEIKKSGLLVKQLEYVAKESDGTWHKHRLTIDKNTESTRLADLGEKNFNDSTKSFINTMGHAISKLAEWGLATGIVYTAFNKLREGFDFVNELNKSLTEIGIVTYQNQEQTKVYASEYNNLAKAMSVTTGDIAKASVEFYRQGLTQAQVMERLKTTTQYAKISNLEFDESAKILTATVNSMGEPIGKVSDIFSYLGDATATGSDEIGRAMQKVAGSANALQVPLEKVSSWIKCCPLV